ncbi:FAD-binding oxidoreductase [Paucibacter sp. O1-1]|nr:FAD-binding oxidoreductase [Paucibacter sp. O1-1]MDA3829080.1 FAD-binding oxidoreductase [Paucibacter sp. O1-1]
MQRRRLVQAMAAAGLLALAPQRAYCTPGLMVHNITGLYGVAVARIERPQTTAEVSRAIQAWPGRIAVGGARYSMGGQIAISGGLHLDMRAMKQLVWLNAAERRARVQAGMTWRDLQDLLDPLDLAVKTMQSFSNFSVGGAVSVNAHGRYIGHGPVGNTVRALQLVLADGSVLETSREQHAALFRAAIGGYGAVGVITEIELELADNTRIERLVRGVALDDYLSHFERDVLARPDSLMHNADLLPPHFDAPVSVTWRRSDKALTEAARLVPRDGRHGLEQNLIWAMTELPAGEQLRTSLVHPLLVSRPAIKWLNHEASLDVATLEPRTRRISTYVLQEFFIPKRHFIAFARGLGQALRRNKVVAPNVSIRHSPADTLSCLPWAKEEVFSFVLYFKQRSHARALAEVGHWTRELIDLALAHEGRYYLPYQPHATRAQFERAYPEASELRRVKREVDPDGKFSNQLWARYLD